MKFKCIECGKVVESRESHNLQDCIEWRAGIRKPIGSGLNHSTDKR